MTTEEIRKAYLNYFKDKKHVEIPRALIVPQNDPSTLFTGSGMQPLIPYLLGLEHPDGTRLVDSQTCLRAQDIEDVGDNRHTTFFEMLGNWSLGDYFKQEQLAWMFEFLIDIVKIDLSKFYVTCFLGEPKFNIPKDTLSGEIWKKLYESKNVVAGEVEIGSEADGYKIGIPENTRIFYYDASKNWWCRNGTINEMPEGEPGGADSEMFYRFDDSEHTPEEKIQFGEKCHPNCDCGRFMEIGNNVFMEYVKAGDGFMPLPKQNVDHGSGLERIAAAAIDNPDVFKISLLWPIIEKLEELSGKKYEANTTSMRVISDHLRGATFLAVDNVIPSNKEQGYVARRLVRRAIRYAFDLGIEQNLCSLIVPIITNLYSNDYPEMKKQESLVIDILTKEEKIFRQTLRAGVRELNKISGKKLTGETVFKLYDTYGFPAELSVEEAYKNNLDVDLKWQEQFPFLMQEQKERSRTATKGEFKGGLADHSEITTQYHTATHLMYKALRMVLGDHVIQRGSNITEERLRFDFSHNEKMSPEQISKIEEIVNQQIDKDWPVSWREENTKDALASGVMGAFGDRYGDMVKVYTVGDPDGENYSREICGGPHVTHTGELGHNGRKFKILKEESSSAGVRRIKAILK